VTGKIIVVIPARGGSKRVARKNIRDLGGKPLLAYSIVAARHAGFGDVTVVSTEDAEIAAIAHQWGAQVVDRPTELATDVATTESVLIHALDHVGQQGWQPEWIATLPPTSPLRQPKTIAGVIDAAVGGNVDCVFSLTESRGDYWRRDSNGHLTRLFPDAPRRQQDRSPLYEENSAIYVTRSAALRRTGLILGNTQKGVVMDPIEGFDINSEQDFLIGQALIRDNPTIAPWRLID
jgi:CMP-N,N'-diacetyllegionaminic acid synthase